MGFVRAVEFCPGYCTFAVCCFAGYPFDRAGYLCWYFGQPLGNSGYSWVVADQLAVDAEDFAGRLYDFGFSWAVVACPLNCYYSWDVADQLVADHLVAGFFFHQLHCGFLLFEMIVLKFNLILQQSIF